MDIKIVIKTASSRHQNELQVNFSEGLKRHGQKHYLCGSDVFPECDLALFWGHRMHDLIERQRLNGRDYMVAERGYIGDRFAWTSLGYNGLNGRADFLNKGKDSERWDKHFDHLMHPWKYGGDYIIIMGQVSGDASLTNLRNFNSWVEKILETIRQHHTMMVVYRPHPLARQASPNGLRVFNGVLEEDLKGAALAVTYNSNSGVDAVLAGVPTITMDEGSMAWSVTSHDPAHVIYPDRTGWAAALAWCQWKPEEIRNGDAWEHLKQKYEA